MVGIRNVLAYTALAGWLGGALWNISHTRARGRRYEEVSSDLMKVEYPLPNSIQKFSEIGLNIKEDDHYFIRSYACRFARALLFGETDYFYVRTISSDGTDFRQDIDLKLVEQYWQRNLAPKN